MERQLTSVLRLLARHGDVSQVLRAVCVGIESQIENARASILLLDRARLHLRHGAAPHLPEGYMAAFDGLAIAPRAGSCGTAAWRNEMVIVEDISTDPLWASFREVALAHGLRACWSHPIRRPTGEIAGTLAIYHDEPRRPTADEICVAEELADLASIALEIHDAQEERRETAERMVNLTANVPGMVFQWTLDGEAIRFPFVSDGARTLIGLDPEAIMEDPAAFLSCFAEPERDKLLAGLRNSATTMTPAAQDIRFRHPTHGEKWLLIRSRPRRTEDGSVVSDALGLDISDHKNAELSLQRSREELRTHVVELERAKARQEAQSAMLMETARELTSARDAAEEASRAKSQFLSNMSHELRTPLNAIIGFSEMIKEQTFGPIGSPRYRDYALDIYESGRHLLELINEILDLAKAESGRDVLNEEQFGVADLIGSAVRIVRSRAEKDGIALTVDMPDSAFSIRGDERKLRQVLLNLVTNAIKFTERGGTVTLSCWRRPQSGVVFQITDTGIGIALEDIPKALGLFGQIDNAFSRRHEGTGLGLPLAKSLIELHGGSMDLQSQLGIGTTVTLRLPPERVVPGTEPVARAG